MLLLAITGGIAAVSVGANIYQGIQNRRLRRQIEMLMAIISNLQSDIEELKKQVIAAKKWAFREKSRLKKEIKALKKELINNSQKLRVLQSEEAA